MTDRRKIWVSLESRDLLRRLAEESGLPMQEVLAGALEAWRATNPPPRRGRAMARGLSGPRPNAFVIGD